MANLDDLGRILRRIDGRGYPAYKELRGGYEGDGVSIHVDHVQGDPFAAPSKLRVRVPGARAGLPDELFSNAIRRLSLEDFLARQVARAVENVVRGRRGSGKSGLVAVDAGGQEVLERTAVVVCDAWVETRLVVGLPAAGRRVLGREAEAILCRELPEIASRALEWRSLPQAAARRFVDCVENQQHMRSQLEALDLVAFVADGAVLPRQSGISDRPLEGTRAVAFRSPDSLRVGLELVHPLDGGCTRLEGMGVPKGVTLIVGGGYHGKSTLLGALERGVYPHVPDDGREGVVTSPHAVKIRAEDGRRVERVDISAFIGELPQGRSTRAFCSDDSSGSTSQAANIAEALEAGARVLLLDEDTCATNFMIRDARMQALVAKEHEPITPFLDNVRTLYEQHGVSTVLVMGGCGDYFDVADSVVMMREFLPWDVTREAKAIATEQASVRRVESAATPRPPAPRIPLASSFDPSRGRRDVKIDVPELDAIRFGTERIELRGVEQIVDVSQTRAAGYALHLAAERFMDGKRTLCQVLDAVEAFLSQEGLEALDPFRRGEAHPGDFARPRRYEIAAAINRLRSVRMRQQV